MTTISDTEYFGLLKETLTENWSKYNEPLGINNDDLTAGMTLFAKIAARAIDTSGSVKESESPSLSASHEVSLETASLGGTVDKIKAFVEDKAYRFRRVCQTGFPFSLLESHPTELALKHALEGFDSILFHFMMLEGSCMSESELDERFGRPFQRLQTSEIAEACSYLKTAYVRDKNKKAGYYLLWLIKQATGCVYEIPENSSFNDATVAKVLSGFFAGSVSIRNTTNFVEILHYEGLYQEFLDPKSCSIFLIFTVRQLVEIPMEKWPIKASIIRVLFNRLTVVHRFSVARALALSEDHTTSEVGDHLLAAIKARSLREAVPHFYALQKLLQWPSGADFMIIFGRPFVEFCKPRSIFNEYPEFIKPLIFNGIREVFIHGSLMMGVYNNHTRYGGKGIPPHLLAYDMNTEKIVWGIPLISNLPRSGPREYLLKRVGELISLQFAGEKKLHFIHPETGEFDSILEFPEDPTHQYDELHVGPKGFVYQFIHKGSDSTLIGGRFIDKQWRPSFEAKAPKGWFYGFSTHCGFTNLLKKTLVLFGPTGDQVTIEGCLEVIAEEDTLYSIEKDPVDKDKCLLKVRTLKADTEVVSGVEKSISLNVKEASFCKICKNGQVILFAGRSSHKSPVFVTLDSQEVTYSPYKFLPELKNHVVNTDSGELWILDKVSTKIWKVSSANITTMGSWERGGNMILVHADKADRLYFINYI